MAHFARLDENNLVTEVVVISDGDIIDENGIESENKGKEFCQILFGGSTNWVQTSYNNNFRKRFAGVGFKYIEETDVFALPQPYPSWSYNAQEDLWESPVPKPEDGENYTWKWEEETKNWIIVYA